MSEASSTLESSIGALCARVEALAPGSRTGVCIASDDGSKLARSYFPNLPASFQAGIRELPMGAPYFGSCTAAMQGRETITIHDITKEGRFDERFITHCLQHAIRSVQSRPVFDRRGNPLGTFVMGFTEPRTASRFDQAVMDFAADAAAEILQRQRDQAETA